MLSSTTSTRPHVRADSLNLRHIVAAEAILCFALPAYFLFWGVLTLPIWVLGARSGAGYAAVHALSTLGGCLGLWALFKTLRYYVSTQPIKTPRWGLMALFMTIGVA